MKFMESPESDLLELIGIYSPTGHEEKAASRFCYYLCEAGASDVHLDIAGNAVGFFPGEGISVLICGHIDTVIGKLPVSRTGDTITGRGAVDAKASLIALLFGAQMARERGFKGTMIVVAAVGEESSGSGIKEVSDSIPRTDYAIFGEPSGTTGITVGYRGRMLIELSYKTKAHHASAPWMDENAVELAMESWRRIKEKFVNAGEFSKPSVELTSIRGGSAHNVTASTSRILMDARFPPSVKKDNLFEFVREVSKVPYSKYTPNLSILDDSPPYVSKTNGSLVNCFKRAIESVSGEKAKLIFKSGSGDMSYLAGRWKIPCVTYGPGETKLSHTNEERISVRNVRRSAEIVAETLMLLEK